MIGPEEQSPEHQPDPPPDPRRWVTLAIVVIAALIVVLDNTVLTVAIPSILADFHTTLPSLQWVLTGYSLVFATLLIIGGRLGDVFGHRRMFIIGAALFGAGSLLAALSWSVPSLLVGEALIEGIGASMMLPATLAILSNTFQGRERATAFAAWGATIGLGGALGPLIGGFLTTNYSWRWAFGINVIVAPLAILGALLFIPLGARARTRLAIDVPGALLVAAGMFLLVFGLNEVGRYGWWKPLAGFEVAGVTLWPKSAGVSVLPVIFLLSAAFLFAFYRYERMRERRDRDPLFEFGQLRHKGFRYGLITAGILSMGQLGLFFVIPVFLQEAEHLSALDNGLWMLPVGVFLLIGAQVGGRMTRRINTTRVVQIGIVLEVIGLVIIAFTIHPGLTLVELLPGWLTFGFGIGFANSQLTNVVLSDVDPEKSGVASGANSTSRQVGSALGVAVIGAAFASLTARNTIEALRATSLSDTAKQAAISGVNASGAGFRPGAKVPPDIAAKLSHALTSGITHGTRGSLLIAAGFVAFGACMSLLIPRVVVPGVDDLDLTIDRVEIVPDQPAPAPAH
jgi:EmrB/QacA subfamily drug resistance transporter